MDACVWVWFSLMLKNTYIYFYLCSLNECVSVCVLFLIFLKIIIIVPHRPNKRVFSFGVLLLLLLCGGCCLCVCLQDHLQSRLYFCLSVQQHRRYHKWALFCLGVSVYEWVCVRACVGVIYYKVCLCISHVGIYRLYRNNWMLVCLCVWCQKGYLFSVCLFCVYFSVCKCL